MCLVSRRQSNTSDCIVLSSEDESDNDETNSCNPSHEQLFNSADDGDYWENIARITFDFFSDEHQPNFSRPQKRSYHSQSPSSSSGENQRNKRVKSSCNDDIEVIALSSSDSSDNDEE